MKWSVSNMSTLEEAEEERKRIVKLLDDFKVRLPCCRRQIVGAIYDGRTGIVGRCWYGCGQDLGRFNKIFQNR